MYKSIVTIILLASNFAQASSFKLNNKNLNTVAAMICNLNANTNPTKKKDLVFSQFEIDITTIGPKVEDKIFNVSGTCNNKIDTRSEKVTKLGEEFSLSIQEFKNQKVRGKIGIKDILVTFNQEKLESIKIINSLTGTHKSLVLSSSVWANSDSIYNLKSGENIRIDTDFFRLKESNAHISITRNGLEKFYNIWSYNSFSCYQKGREIEQELCHELTHQTI